jgi:ADP-heptose:LPS heptosyltransferase
VSSIVRAASGGPVTADRIAVLRGGGLGDLVFALPALEALRARFPHAEITLIGEPWLARLVVDRAAVDDGPPLADRHVPLTSAATAWLAGRGSLDDARAADGIARRIRLRPPDLAIQLHGGGRHTNPFVASLGARLTVGLRTPDAAPLDRWVPYVYYQSEVMRALEVVGLLGATPVSIEPRLVPRSEPGSSGALDGADAAAPLVVLHPAASDARRWWPAAAFSEVARRLAPSGVTIAIVGSGEDSELGRRIAEAAGSEAGVVDLTGRLDGAGLEGVLARATVIVGNDSGPLHLAAALGAATVGIYWCGNLVNAGPAWRSRHRPAIAWRLHCPVCGADNAIARCEHQASFVADVTPDEVTASALDLLASAAGGAPATSP